MLRIGALIDPHHHDEAAYWPIALPENLVVLELTKLSLSRLWPLRSLHESVWHKARGEFWRVTVVVEKYEYRIQLFGLSNALVRKIRNIPTLAGNVTLTML